MTPYPTQGVKELITQVIDQIDAPLLVSHQPLVMKGASQGELTIY